MRESLDRRLAPQPHDRVQQVADRLPRMAAHRVIEHRRAGQPRRVQVDQRHRGQRHDRRRIGRATVQRQQVAGHQQVLDLSPAVAEMAHIGRPARAERPDAGGHVALVDDLAAGARGARREAAGAQRDRIGQPRREPLYPAVQRIVAAQHQVRRRRGGDARHRHGRHGGSAAATPDVRSAGDAISSLRDERGAGVSVARSVRATPSVARHLYHDATGNVMK